MKKKTNIQTLINWFFGNYCTRKCYDEDEKRYEHWLKLQDLAKIMKGVEMTHAEFLHFIRSDKTICNLNDEEWKNRKFSWEHTDCSICKAFRIRF